MENLGKTLQVIGLCLTGFAAAQGFWREVREGEFIALGFGGFLIFVVGQWLRGKRS
jgi:hypothetical protein